MEYCQHSPHLKYSWGAFVSALAAQRTTVAIEALRKARTSDMAALQQLACSEGKTMGDDG